MEISAKADEAGLPASTRDAALRLFHQLTDRIGQAVVALDVTYQDWPLHRFYFSSEQAELSRLLSALRRREDILDVSGEFKAGEGSVAGLFAAADDAGTTGVLVAHEDHETYVDP